MRLCILLVVGLSGCSDEDKGEDTSLTDKEKEANANVACAVYSPLVVRAIENRCYDQMVAVWGDQQPDDPEAIAPWLNWENEAQAAVQIDCVGYALAASDFDDIRYIISGICYYGYSPAHYEEWLEAACEDWVEDTESFVVDYPYVDYCPCLDSGEWHVEGPDSTAECGAGHDPV